MKIEHELHAWRVRIGRGVISHRPTYGTKGQCGCGAWHVQVNLAPSNGGTREVERRHARHLADVREAAIDREDMIDWKDG